MNDIFNNINTFSDVYKLSKTLTPKKKGDLFELLTKYVFLVHPNYMHKTSKVWMYSEIPTDLIDQFKLPKKDKGIDLLLKTNDDKYHAIQCKFRNDLHDSITWAKLSTFAGQLFVGDFKSAIYVTNTYNVNEEICKCDKISCLYGDFFKDENL